MFLGQEKNDRLLISAVHPLQQLNGIFNFTYTHCQIAAAKASVSS